MSTDSLDALVARLARGDDAAAEQLLRAYEPYLRMIIRRRLSGALRARFDSIDIVQSVWADVVQGLRAGNWTFTDWQRLRAFLITMTRNRFLDQVRQQQPQVRCEEPLETMPEEPPSSHPRPSEIVGAEDLWRQMLLLCPPAHREVLHLRRQGLTLAEIAAQTGTHESSIRRILYDLARRLAVQRKIAGMAPEDPN